MSEPILDFYFDGTCWHCKLWFLANKSSCPIITRLPSQEKLLVESQTRRLSKKEPLLIGRAVQVQQGEHNQTDSYSSFYPSFILLFSKFQVCQ